MAAQRKKRRRISVAMAINYLFFTLLLPCELAPLLLVLSKSLSGEAVILSGRVGVLPNFSDLHLDAYRLVFQNANFLQGLKNTVLVTAFGTLAAVATTALCAYALSKSYLRGRRGMLVLCIFTMIFSGGLIPTYLAMNDLGLINTFHILWMAGVFSTTNMLILRTCFESVPRELEESATIDGAGHLAILTRVYLPLSKAMLAVIALYYAVDYWNNFNTSMIYTTQSSLKSLQLVLKETIFSASDVFMELYGMQSLGEVTAQSSVAACVVVATLPILLVYPFVQKYFTKGVLIGAVKG
jgi:putative aldouronate transport system permease protein